MVVATAESADGSAVFDTTLGSCRVSWNEQGLTGVRLPGFQTTAAALRPLAEAPVFVQEAAAAMQRHLAGSAQTLREVPLDRRRAGAFEWRVYEAARALDPGQTCTYGELARSIGEPAAARAVGAALGANPWPLVIPCHRVLAAGGQLGGFSAPGGSETKRRILVIEAAMRSREGELF